MSKLGLGLSVAQTRVGPFYDPDALSYFKAVETADGQDLEGGVKAAINTFIIGCKSDGIWPKIVACCILAGARTVAGSLIPLRGIAPTNNNFVGGDYNRKTGLIGNDSNKYLATGYNNNDTTNFPTNDTHMACYVSQGQTDSAGTLVGGVNSIGARLSFHYNTPTNIQVRNRATTTSSISLAPLGFQCTSRDNSTTFLRRFTTIAGVSDATVGAISGVPASDPYGVLAAGNGTQFSNARISFYSFGKSLPIINFDLRVSTLIQNISAAIP